MLGMMVSALLAVIKLLAGWQGHSAAVFADGLESCTDVFGSGLVVIGLSLAALPPDENHPYGHGRVETITGLMLGFLLFAAGCGIAWHGITGASDAQTPAPWTMVPLLLSICAKGSLAFLKWTHGRRIKSDSLRVDAAHDAVDLMSGLMALTAVSLTLWRPVEFARADHYGAFAVGLFVVFTSIRLMYDASLNLMDTMPDDSSMARIREVALAVADVRGVEKCFARKTGLKYHVDLHLEVDPEISVRDSHDVACRVRDTIRAELAWVEDVLVHVEPWPGLIGK
jgi:cation diffusion facilitator family transporter